MLSALRDSGRLMRIRATPSAGRSSNTTGAVMAGFLDEGFAEINEFESLSHTSWECKSTPQRRDEAVGIQTTSPGGMPYHRRNRQVVSPPHAVGHLVKGNPL